MLQNNPLLAQLKQQLHQQTPRVEGIVRAHEKGYGFLETDNKKSYFIPVNKMKKVQHGDRVSGQILLNGDREAFEPETLIKSSLQDFLGKISFETKSIVITPENFNQVTLRCKVNDQVQQHLKAGDWVKAKLISHPLDKQSNGFFAEITQFVAEGKCLDLLWLKTLANYNLESLAPEDELFTQNSDELTKRTDFTHIDFFTIDGEETRDMDDAISIAKDKNGNYLLTIAIADPSSYFDEKSTTNKEAIQRCFSTYLPNFTVPMLPKGLANELCSLKENEKRPALVCQMYITPQGDIIDEATQFYLAWVSSKAKLSYRAVSDFIEDNIALPSQITTLPQQLMLLASLAQVRTQWRDNNALLFKDNAEYRFIFDNNRQLIDITKESKRIAHKMVEEAMVVANQAFTHKISHQLGFGLFNIHNGFEPKYFDLIVKLLDENHIDGFDKERLATFAGYKDLHHLLEGNDLLEYRLRRYLAPAGFSLEPKAHFAMGFSCYATWTSPIRKYGDLLNHRLIKTLLLNKTLAKPNSNVLAIMNERRKAIRLAERDINERLYSQFLSDKVGQEFNAEIIDINRGGARVRLTDLGAVAFMPLSFIHPVRNEIIAQPEEGLIKIKDKTIYQLLNTVKVIVNEVKVDNASIIVKLASHK